METLFFLYILLIISLGKSLEKEKKIEFLPAVKPGKGEGSAGWWS